jgi:DNA-binding MarR family transcriptional regulator
MRRPNRKRSRNAKQAGAAAGVARRRGRRAPSVASATFVASFQLLIGEIFRFNGRLLDQAAALSLDLGITPTHWQTVAVIRDAPMTVSQISRRIGLRRQSVQHTVHQLKARGLVELVANPHHQRAKLVRLTPAGKALMRRLLARQVRLTHLFTRGLGYSKKDIEILITTLRRMQEAAGEPAGAVHQPGLAAPR